MHLKTLNSVSLVSRQIILRMDKPIRVLQSALISKVTCLNPTHNSNPWRKTDFASFSKIETPTFTTQL